MKELIKQFDILNTINGGVSMTYVDVKKFDDRLEINIEAPTVKAEAFNIFLNGNKLVIFSTLETGGPESLNFPMFSKSFALPANADGNSIEANERNGIVKVVVPLNENKSSQSRKINITHN